MDRLIELRHICIELASEKKQKSVFYLSEDTWDKLTEIVSVLKIFRDKTVCLQKRNLVMTDALGIWLEIEARLKSIPENLFASVFLNAVVHRKKIVIENDVMYAAMFLDPRFQIMLSLNEISVAKKHLKYLHEKQTLKSNTISTQLPLDQIAADGMENTEDNFLENIMREIELKKRIEEQSTLAHSLCDRSFDVEFSHFLGTKRLVATADVMKYWSENRFNFPILHSLAKTVFAVPSSQVDVERHFSSSSFVLNKYRNRLSDENLDMILFLKLNESIFYEAIDNGLLLD